MREISVGVLYPWTGLPSMDRGSARRLVPLVSLLAENFSRVTVFSPGGGPTHYEGADYVPVNAGALERRFVELAREFYEGITYHAFNRLDIRSRRQWWNFLQPLLQRSLHRALRQASETSDVLLLEYPFWSRALEGVMGRKRKPVALTLLDLLSGICKNPWMERRVHRCEIAAARRAQAVVCVTEEETRKMRDEGIDAINIPHGFVFRDEPAPDASRPDDPMISEIARRIGSGETGCLFLGSSLIPNREAAESVAEIARGCKTEDRLVFVTAGACCGPGRPAPNVFSLGPISENDLKILYSICKVVLAPLRSGTGASTKVIEALSKKKILVTTRVGIRGYEEIRHGVEAIISDDLAHWPVFLRDVATNPALRMSLSTCGNAFAKKYDYRTVYRPYLDIISQLADSTS